MRIFTLLLLGFMIFAGTAQAGEIISAGTPKNSDLTTDPGFIYTDIYSRQILYKATADDHMSRLLERQKNYGAPSLEVYRNYAQQMDDLHTGKNPVIPVYQNKTDDNSVFVDTSKTGIENLESTLDAPL